MAHGLEPDAGRVVAQPQGKRQRDAVVERQKSLDRELARAVQMAIETGELKADTDPRQVSFDTLGIILAFNRVELLFGTVEATRRARAAFDRLIDQYRT